MLPKTLSANILQEVTSVGFISISAPTSRNYYIIKPSGYFSYAYIYIASSIVILGFTNNI